MIEGLKGRDSRELQRATCIVRATAVAARWAFDPCGTRYLGLTAYSGSTQAITFRAFSPEAPNVPQSLTHPSEIIPSSKPSALTPAANSFTLRLQHEPSDHP